MANRYGRNQKRRHLAEIATLQVRVEELLGPWERARPDDFIIDPRYVQSAVETKRDEKRHLLEYEVELQVSPYPALEKFIFDQQKWDAFVNWKGYSWKMNARFERMSNRSWESVSSYTGGQEWFRLELVNLRRPPYK